MKLLLSKFQFGIFLTLLFFEKKVSGYSRAPATDISVIHHKVI